MICPQCKNKNENGFKYCSSCGQWMLETPEEDDISIEEEKEDDYAFRVKYTEQEDDWWFRELLDD